METFLVRQIFDNSGFFKSLIYKNEIKKLNDIPTPGIEPGPRR